MIEGNWPESLFVVTWGRRLRYVTATPKPGQPVDLGDLVLPPTTGITGRIVDARGFGLAGARVRAIDLPPELLEDFPLWRLLEAKRSLYARRPDTAAEVADFWHRLMALPDAPDNHAVLQRPAWLDGVANLWPFVEVETQFNGGFELHGLRASRSKTTLVVTKGGYVTVVDEVDVDQQRVLDVGTLELPPAAVARGQVFGTDGMPLANAEVWVAPVAPNGSPVHFALPSVRTDSEGSFEVPGITTDLAYLAVRAGPSDPWIVQEHSVRGFMTVLMPPRHQVAFRLVSRRHKAVGRPEVTLLPGHRTLAHVRRGLIDAPVLGARLWQRKDGRWRIDELLPGRYTLVVRTSGHMTHALHLTVDRSQEHVIYLDPVRSLNIRVQDGRFEPVEGAQVYARSLSPRGPLAGITLACGETDAEGKVTIDRVVGKRVAVTAIHPIHGIAHRAAELMNRNEWHLRLALPGRIAGRLTDTADPGRWTVEMRPIDAHRALPPALAFAAPDETGGFVHTLLPQGRYRVRAIRTLGGSHPREDIIRRLLDDGSETSGVLVDSTGATFVYLATQAEEAADAPEPEPAGAGPAEPAPPTLAGTVRFSDGRPAEGIRLELRAVGGGKSHTAHTDKRGRFHVQHLEDGSYEVLGRGPGPSRCRLEIVVRDGKTEPVAVRMTDGVFVDGRLAEPAKLRGLRFVRLDAKGNWLDANGEVIEVKDIPRLTAPSVQLDASGRFQNPIVLRAGRYHVTRVPGETGWRWDHRITIQIGDTDREDLVIPDLRIDHFLPWIYPLPKASKQSTQPRKSQKPREHRRRRQRR